MAPADEPIAALRYFASALLASFPSFAPYTSWALQPQPPHPAPSASAFPPLRCYVEQQQQRNHQLQRPSLHLNLDPATLSPSSSSSSLSSSPTPSLPSSPAFKFAQFDVDHRTGFAPNGTNESTRLPPAYDLWEHHLASANSTLSLGQDTSSAALARRPSGARWRKDFLSVSLFLSFPITTYLHHYLHHYLPFPPTSARVPPVFFRIFPRFPARPSPSSTRPVLAHFTHPSVHSPRHPY
jgi:hypothetical protein